MAYIYLGVYLLVIVFLNQLLGSGPCDYPTDIAMDGSLCGQRAASVRSGGRNPTVFWITWFLIFAGVAYFVFHTFLKDREQKIEERKSKKKFISPRPEFDRESGQSNWDGPWSQYYENGQLMSKGTYKDGKAIGDWKEYYENGNLKNETTHDYSGREVLSVSYFENGQISHKGYTINHYRTGFWEVYYDNGQLLRRWQVDETKKDGDEIVYFKDGSIASQRSYENGTRVGTWLSYYENGNLEWRTTYKENEIIKDEYFHKNGNPSMLIDKTGGRRKTIFYDESGEITEKHDR